MRTFGLVGFPLGHSFSKKYFTEKFERENLKDCIYKNFDIPGIGRLSNIVSEDDTLEGLNITIPYKQQVIPFLTECDDVVRQAGACNCIRVLDHKLYGFNTDVIGFERSLQEKLLPHHRRALILGTGGSSKAVHYVLQKLGIEQLFVSRTANSKEGVLSYELLNAEKIADYPLIINTTPLGMFPNVNELPAIPYDGIGPRHYLFDLVYNPDMTAFLQKGMERGAVIKNGSDMLAIQAEESWKIWNR